LFSLMWSILWLVLLFSWHFSSTSAGVWLDQRRCVDISRKIQNKSSVYQIGTKSCSFSIDHKLYDNIS
jgi:hypothetical protein